MKNERTPLVTCIKHIVLTKNVLQMFQQKRLTKNMEFQQML